MTSKLTETTLITDKEWDIIDGECCKVIEFNSLASVKSGQIQDFDTSTPYASVTLECKKIPGRIIGFITNKTDFMNLWTAFKERTVTPDEEVLMFWTKKNYKLKLIENLPSLWPKVWVMICPKEAYELMTDQDYKPELQGEARAIAQMPIIDWKPEVMS